MKRSDFPYMVISFLPILLLAICYNNLADYPNTHIYGSGGMTLYKMSFVILLAVVNVIWYYTSALISEKVMIAGIPVK